MNSLVLVFLLLITTEVDSTKRDKFKAISKYKRLMIIIIAS